MRVKRFWNILGYGFESDLFNVTRKFFHDQFLRVWILRLLFLEFAYHDLELSSISMYQPKNYQ
jgi:hypothetical protein